LGSRGFNLSAATRPFKEQHTDIYNDDVWVEHGRFDQQLATVPDNSNHVISFLEYGADPFRYYAVIVGNENAAADCRTAKIFHNVLSDVRTISGLNSQDVWRP
jgi:hypothetical protein